MGSNDIAADAACAPGRPRAGRPTREQRERRHGELLSVALDIFLEKGFEQATTEEIANAVGMSKRTVYALYPDKAALFRGAVERAVDAFTISLDVMAQLETADLEETLSAVARLRVNNVATPASIKLQRIVIAQAHRFPDLFRIALTKGTGPTIQFLADLLARRSASGEIVVTDPERAATAFLSLVVGGPARLIVAGASMDEQEIEERIRFAVGLFLNGVRKR